ncbi:MAG: ABC transporter ATP-binding protein [Burkholderiaceae bacterium]|jgi:branched-chain amino acid transport system ATP-binding protein|nr:ABC transporter ATP-binding protein [Polynucleobacter sp.]MCF8187630.1 ABC transporter ATP-binding protein [Sulfuritalea sp.]
MLRAQCITAAYGDAQALFGIDFSINAGEIVALIGANGAGKSTFLKTLTGLLPVRSGELEFEGQSLRHLDAGDIVKLGIAMVPEGRRLFPSLTVEENLLMGTLSGRKGSWDLSRVFTLFPILQEKRSMPSTSLSGGQQQMVAIGRALMSNPRLLLCDEISLGLAPVVIREIYAALPAIMEEGMSLLIVEQDVQLAMQASSRVVCLQEGLVSLEGKSSELSRDQISKAYFGI